jgi:AcrR family transcriptional regulator
MREAVIQATGAAGAIETAETSETAPAVPEPRPTLSRDRVLRTAVSLADRRGIDALTMRRLARELGVEAMSLYHHVADKDDLLDGIVDLVLGEIDLAPTGDDWKATLRRGTISAHDVLVRHPWAATLMSRSPTVRPARLRFMEWILATLADGGFSRGLTDHAYHALDSHITGSTLWLVSMQLEGKDLRDVGARFLRTLPVEEYPHVAQHIAWHIEEPDGEGGSEFEFGLDLILDGLERLRDG